MVLDSDHAGRTLAKNLAGDLYAGSSERILGVTEFTGIEDSEIEDLAPPALISGIVTRVLRTVTEDFADVAVAGKAIVPQIEAFAQKHGIPLELGWKVEIAKMFVAKILKNPEVIDKTTEEKWKALFDKLES